MTARPILQIMINEPMLSRWDMDVWERAGSGDPHVHVK